MAEIIESGAGNGRFPLRVTKQNRASTDGLTESLSAQMSRDGMLYGTGTGYMTTTWTDDFYQVLFLRNDDPDNLFHVQKLVFGWNGGSTNHNRVCESFILYQVDEPTTANNDAAPAIENISKSGTSAAVTDTKATAWKWDGTGTTGMANSSTGFFQIPNCLSQGNTSIQIDGEIILGQNDTMALYAKPEEAGRLNMAIVYYKAPIGGRI